MLHNTNSTTDKYVTKYKNKYTNIQEFVIVTATQEETFIIRVYIDDFTVSQ